MTERIIILGAGISGLATAWYLKKQRREKVSICIVDQQERVGGWIQSKRQGDFLFELGPRSLRSRGAGVYTLGLIEDLGLQDEVLIAAPAAHRRYLWTASQLRPLPSGPLSLLYSSLTRRHLRAMLREPFLRSSVSGDENIYDFVSRRFSPAIAEDFFDPMISGIFAGDIRQLSVESCLPALKTWERAKGSVIRGAFCQKKEQKFASPWVKKMQRTALFTFRRGLQTLSERLALALDVDWALGEKVLHLSPETVHTEHRELQADRVISCLPAPALGRLLGPVDAELVRPLQNFPVASLAVVNLGYHRSCLPLQGFGYLIPSKEKEKILGVVFDSSAFPGQNLHSEQTRLTVMIGGVRHPNRVESDDETLLGLAKSALKKHLGLDTPPDEVSVTRVCHALPQYAVGHREQMSVLRQRLSHYFPHLHIRGNFFDGVAVNDCIAQAARSVDSWKKNRDF